MSHPMTEQKRTVLSALVLGVVLLSLLPLSSTLLLTAIYVRCVINDDLNLVQGLSTATLPTFVAVTALINVFSLWLLLSSMARAHRPSTRAKAMTSTCASIIILVLSTVLLLACCIYTFVQLRNLPQLFQGGLGQSLNQYRSVPHVKERVDMLQIAYACCGDNGYKDWFHIPWVSKDTLIRDPLDTAIRGLDDRTYTNDDVPFSCCDPNAVRPCIHHHVTINHLHYRYDHRQNTTLHNVGCRQSLMDYYGSVILRFIVLSLLFLFLLQVIVIVMARLAISSMQTALEASTPTAPAAAFLFRKPGSDEKSIQKGDSDGERRSLLNPSAGSSDGAPKVGWWSIEANPSTGIYSFHPSTGQTEDHYGVGQTTFSSDVYGPDDTEPEPTPTSVTGAEPIYENVITDKGYDHLDMASNHPEQAGWTEGGVPTAASQAFMPMDTVLTDSIHKRSNASRSGRRNSRGFESLGLTSTTPRSGF